MSTPLGVVLAGGAGRRMGGDKALVTLAGRPLISYPLAALLATLEEVVVAAKDDTALPPLPAGVAVWREPAIERHPLLGVRAALRGAGGRGVLVVAADLPLVRPEDLDALLAAGGAAAACSEGRIQPLLALYPPAALPVLDAMAPDEPATAVLQRLEPVLVEVPSTSTLNVNRPEDLVRAEALLGQPKVNE